MFRPEIKQGEGFKYLVMPAGLRRLPKRLRRKIGRMIRRGQITKDANVDLWSRPLAMTEGEVRQSGNTFVVD